MAEGILNYNSLVGQVPKLTKDNYYDWKFSISLILQKTNCWSIVQKAMKDKIRDWKVPKDRQDKANKALTIIGPRSVTIQADQSVQPWYWDVVQVGRSLQKYFTGESYWIDMGILQLQTWSWNADWWLHSKTGDDLEPDVWDQNECCWCWCGGCFDHESQFKFQFSCLSLTSWGLELEVAEVMDILLDEEVRLGVSGNQGEPLKAFISGRRWTGDRPVCWNCNKTGHIQHNCWENQDAGAATVTVSF